MNETVVGKIGVGDGAVALTIAVVDWGKPEEVHIRLRVEGAGFGFLCDFEDPGQIADLFTLARVARKEIVRARYDVLSIEPPPLFPARGGD
jgi:hypothetical protein